MDDVSLTGPRFWNGIKIKKLGKKDPSRFDG